MLLRIFIFVFLLGCTCYEFRKKRSLPHAWLLYALLAVFWSLRYGQGTDYFSYMWLYAYTPTLAVIQGSFVTQLEAGISLAFQVFKTWNFPFYVVVAILSCISTMLIYRFAKYFCPQRLIMVLTSFYGIYSIAYLESALRQSLSMSLVLGVAFIVLNKGKKLLYLLSILVAMSIHLSAAVMLVLVFLPRNMNSLRMFMDKWVLCILSAAVMAVIFVNIMGIENILKYISVYLQRRLGAYLRESEISWLALLSRCIIFCLVMFMGWKLRNIIDDRTFQLYVIYSIGFVVYAVLLRYPSVASRFNAYFRIVEIALLPRLLSEVNLLIPKRLGVSTIALIVMVAFLFFKEMVYARTDGRYFETGAAVYPYVTIMDRNAIYIYRDSDAFSVQLKNSRDYGTYY